MLPLITKVTLYALFMEMVYIYVVLPIEMRYICIITYFVVVIKNISIKTR